MLSVLTTEIMNRAKNLSLCNKLVLASGGSNKKLLSVYSLTETVVRMFTGIVLSYMQAS